MLRMIWMWAMHHAATRSQQSCWSWWWFSHGPSATFSHEAMSWTAEMCLQCSWEGARRTRSTYIPGALATDLQPYILVIWFVHIFCPTYLWYGLYNLLCIVAKMVSRKIMDTYLVILSPSPAQLEERSASTLEVCGQPSLCRWSKVALPAKIVVEIQ